MKAVLVIDMPEGYETEDLLIDYCLHTKGEYKSIRKSGNNPLKPIERHEKGEVSEEVKEEHRQMMKEIDAVRCELHHIESDNKMLKEVIIRMAMEHTGVVK